MALVLAPVAHQRAAAQAPRYRATALVAGSFSWGLDISEAGHVVGAFYAPGPHIHGFQSQDGRTIDLGEGLRLATAINGADQIVGQPAVIRRDGTFVDLGIAGEWTQAYSLNDSGQVVGTYYPPGFVSQSGFGRAFLWQNGVTTDLGSLDGSESVATSINASGQIVGFAFTASGVYHAFLWEHGVMTDLGTLGGADTLSAAYAINDVGQVVGFAETFSTQCFPGGIPRSELHAVLWDHGTVRDLQAIRCHSTVAYDINNVGQIVGAIDRPLLYIDGITVNGGPGTAFLYTNGGMTDLGIFVPHGLSIATAINDLGQIAASGDDGAYRLDPVDPASDAACATPDPFVALGGGLCLNGGWLPPGLAPPPPPLPVPVTPPPASSCATPDPFVALGGGTCYNGGWLPPGISAPAPPSATPPSSPPPSPDASCARPDPFVALGGGTCSNGGWFPPGVLAPATPPASAPAPPTGACSTPDPFATIPGLVGLCVNGGWIPIIRGS